MPRRKQGDEEDWFEDFLTPNDMRQWAEREVRAATKALELRTKEVTEIARAYSAGEITPEKADELHARYNHRWGESLPGAMASEGRTDEQIMAAIDKATGRFETPRHVHDHVQRMIERKPGGKER